MRGWSQVTRASWAARHASRQVQKEILAELARGQRPYATILGCSDSRVPPELVFDAGFGELFIVRVAGNVISAEIMGTLQYAGLHLRTPLFVVLGHEGCGAVEAALAATQHNVDHPERIALLLQNIEPGLRNLRCGAVAGGTTLRRGRSKRPVVNQAAARHAGGQGAPGGRRDQAGRRHLRVEHRARQIPAVTPLSSRSVRL